MENLETKLKFWAEHSSIFWWKFACCLPESKKTAIFAPPHCGK